MLYNLWCVNTINCFSNRYQTRFLKKGRRLSKLLTSIEVRVDAEECISYHTAFSWVVTHHKYHLFITINASKRMLEILIWYFKAIEFPRVFIKVVISKFSTLKKFNWWLVVRLLWFIIARVCWSVIKVQLSWIQQNTWIELYISYI